MIKIHEVQKSFGPTKVIPNMSLNIPLGETHILLGSSGCGKTTLLRMMAGLCAVDAGEVSLNGDDVSKLSPYEISNRVGYVIQEGGLMPHLNAIDNILLPIKVRRADMNVAKERLNNFARSVELTQQQLKRFPHELSGGQRQRVALIRGLILNQPIILLDEPLSALDPVVRMNLQIHLKKLFNKLEKTVVLVTHDLNVASYLGDRISLLDKGRIVQQGRYIDLLEKPKNDFVRDFVRAQTPNQRDVL